MTMLVEGAEQKLILRLRQLRAGVYLLALAKDGRGVVELVVLGQGKVERLGEREEERETSKVFLNL
jgi:hypothetical protein